MGKKISLTDFELPDGFESVEDLIKKITELTGKVPTLEQQAALAAKFSKWGNPDDLEARLNLHIQKQVQAAKEAAIAEAKAAGASGKEARQAGTAAADDIYERWNELTPQQQVQFMASQIGGGLEAKMADIAKNYWTEAQKQLGGSAATQQQQFDLLARALDLKLKNPDVELSDVWKTMSEFATATPDKLMELAYKSVELPKQRESWEKEARAKWEAERADKDAAERVKVLNSDSVPSWLKPREERVSLNKDGEDALKNNILKGFLAEGKLRPEQIN